MMLNASCAPFMGLVSIGAWMTASGANSLLSSSARAPASMATRKGCFGMASTPLLGSGGIVPHIGGKLPGIERNQPVSEDLERRIRTVGDCTLQEQTVVVVDQQFQTLDLVSFDRTLPAQEGGFVVEPCLEDIFAGIIPAVSRIRECDRNKLAANDRFDQHGAVHHHIFSKDGGRLLGCWQSCLAKLA